jgi:GNAT superfamily N-acetyltransferase
MRDQIVIRAAVPAERKDLEALQWRASIANHGDRDFILANPDAIDIPIGQLDAGQVYVAQRGDELAGFAAIVPRADGGAELEALFVEPALWRRGIGRQLLEHCAAAASLQRAVALHVVGNPHAADFYAAGGFQSVGTTMTRFGAGILLRRDLVAARSL